MTITNTAFVSIVDAVKANNFIIKDDHNNGRNEMKLDGLAVLKLKSKERLVALLDNTYFCLNEVYLDEEDNLPHLSTNSVGGNVSSHRDHFPSLEAAINYFNLSNKDNEFCPQELVEWELFGETADPSAVHHTHEAALEDRQVFINLAKGRLAAVKNLTEATDYEIKRVERAMADAEHRYQAVKMVLDKL